jgi:undecaprenyl-diphosphatase
MKRSRMTDILSLHTILESLPISSSSHIRILTYMGYLPHLCLSETIEHIMHIPTACTIIIYSLYAWYMYIPVQSYSIHKWFHVLVLVVIANGITVISYGVLKLLRRYRIVCASSLPLYVGLFATACILYASSYIPMRNDFDMVSMSSYDAVIVGLAQACALLPGISRLASTYVAGLYMTSSCVTAFLFSLVIELCLIMPAICVALITYIRSRDTYDVPLVSMFMSYKMGASICIASICLHGVLSMACQGVLYYTAVYMIIPLYFSYVYRSNNR